MACTSNSLKACYDDAVFVILRLSVLVLCPLCLARKGGATKKQRRKRRKREREKNPVRSSAVTPSAFDQTQLTRLTLTHLHTAQGQRIGLLSLFRYLLSLSLSLSPFCSRLLLNINIDK